MAQKILEIKNLAKEYGTTKAVDSISFEVGNGEIVGLLGPNGAGKTTTINMILGILEPTHGSIHIEGIDISTERTKAISITNFAAVYAQVPGNLSVYQNLHVFGLIYDVKNLKQRINEVIAQYEYRKLALCRPSR